ncbi:MAG: FKBP-type peptidyl-prolyl cis-trans isomerase [Bacteroidales bacterium]|nr:FKBP-type peptidyl-prolyl cis-trans isomerase [Bacteroidales bacterium]
MKKLLLLSLTTIFAMSCGSRIQKEDPSEKVKYDMNNQNLITANKYLVKEDAERTENYIKRRSWTMEDGDGGLKYLIFDHGKGDSIVANPSITMDYRVELLDGTVCYDSEKDGKKELIVGNSEMETGLVKMFKKFCHGDSAAIILPPHYAKGLVGDLNQIPPHSVIVYYVRIN